MARRFREYEVKKRGRKEEEKYERKRREDECQLLHALLAPINCSLGSTM